MSINVTVTGNPVSIKRGQMITSDPQTAKKDFEKRRLLRLEQVRQQSKEMAEDVRNKVRREKKKQMGQIEKEGKEKLKNWQNRKLLELQNQYLDALDDIGTAHKEAEELADETEILENQRVKNEEIAKTRGRLAHTKLQVQKNEENYKKAMPVQHKKLVRDIENTRASLVSSMKKKQPKKNVKQCKKTKKRKTTADINITIPNDSDFSEVSSSDSSKHLPSIQEEDHQDSEGFCECSESSEDKNDAEVAYDEQRFRAGPRKSGQDGKGDSPPTNRPQPKHTKSPSKFAPSAETAPKHKSYRESIEDRRKLIDDFRSRPREVHMDTRISDRIKRRQLMAAQPDYCDFIAEPTPVSEVEDSTRIRDRIISRPNNYFGQPKKDPLELSSEECMCTKFHSSCPCKSAEVKGSVSAAVQTDLVEGYKADCKCGPKSEIKPTKATSTSKDQVGKSHSGEVPTQTNVRSGIISSQKISTKASGPPQEIPTKPPVRLKHAGQTTSKTEGVAASVQATTATNASAGAYRVPYYDFRNRFVSDLPSTAHVEKISADSIEVIPDTTSEAEWHERMKQRDIDAQMRGKRALQKEKVQRDYEEMMKKLPILQRKEHIAQIGTDKPEYHMSDERLKERERERQNRLENVYSKAIPDLKPKIVTIPSRKHEIPTKDEPFEILDGDDSRTLNLGKWDTDTKPKTMFSAEEVQEIIKAFTVQKPEDRKTKLKQLLKSLKLQKEQLINEIRALPRDDSINALISDLTSFSDDDNSRHHRSAKHRKGDKDRDKSERKRRHEESDTSTTSTETSSRENKGKSKGRHKDKYGKSPHKKMKKPGPKVLVLQNTSTQTTPKATKETVSTTTSSSVQVSDSKEVLPEGIKICTKSHVPCDCYKRKEGESSEEVCKIYIKLNEEQSPKVEVVRSARDAVDVAKEEKTEKVLKSPRKDKERSSKSPRRERDKERSSKSPISPGKENRLLKEKPKTKSVATETEPFKIPSLKESKTTKSDTQSTERRKVSPRRKRSESWKEHLSKNSMSTSSTSYMSPPDFSKPNTTGSTETSKLSMYNLRKKPQQTNIERSSTLRSSSQFTPDFDPKMDSKMLHYIQRLLSMSKKSVDDLGVSSSDVQTPSQSVIEMETNNPLAALHNVVRFINFKAADIAKELSLSTEEAQVPPNSFVGSSDGSGARVQQDIPERDTNSSSTEKDKAKESLLSQYAEVTDSCSKRIANLAAMIEQLRQEKIQMLKSPPLAQKPTEYSPRSGDAPVVTPTSDKDNSTRYLEFPPSGEKSKGTNSTASMDEEELNRRLLEIDMSLAEKLKLFKQVRSDRSADEADKPGGISVQDQQQQAATSPPVQEQLDQTGQQFLERLQRLIQEGHEREQISVQMEPESPFPAVISEVPFVPMLIDIPKLPILGPAPEELMGGEEKRHPPPSKGLISAKKFNGNISLIPHELSTIIEADSQISTRISPNNSNIGTSLGKDTVHPLTPTYEEESLPTDKSGAKSSEDKSKKYSSNSFTPDTEKKLESTDSSTSKSFTCTEGTCTSLMSINSSKPSSSSSSSDLRSIEAMLKSIGMDWAIPTLHKTQEALALSSSSSSGDLNSAKKTSSRSRSQVSSEVSLKDFLKKQMMSKISSSSLNKSEASPASFIRECSEISAIQANSSAEKVKQKTSTPVMSSKSTSKSKEDQQQQLFTGASDISSVRNSSCEGSCKKSSGKQTFHSLVGDEQSSATRSSVE